MDSRLRGNDVMAPLSFGHFPHQRGKPDHPSAPLDSGFRRNDGGAQEWAFPANSLRWHPLQFPLREGEGNGLLSRRGDSSLRSE